MGCPGGDTNPPGWQTQSESKPGGRSLGHTHGFHSSIPETEAGYLDQNCSKLIIRKSVQFYTCPNFENIKSFIIKVNMILLSVIVISLLNISLAAGKKNKTKMFFFQRMSVF